ncbi:AAA family ATPase [Vibrio diabolicus]|uniref:ATP-binding protein n=3 Tax=Vibrio harveyi group TaxID=717610 RepID=UPI00080F5871|nr:ATP-binding protein [Vibrio diabolicus]MCE3220076.1 AAA family ATPase [Vibrio diabolicus]MDF4734945.1 ATP-binding protein [Vibrio parahaemolyticus]MDG2607652.1 ATP-binding protein [Vibrio parahaemolyticus]OCH72283.1 hypothetical protein A6E00_16490 [Vibrio diabolicus]
MTREKIEILDNAIERRADYIKSEDLIDNTSINDFFSDVIKSLTNRQTTLIVGPRGCGKTHMMRYTALACNSDEKKPLAIYVTFNRYYRLEPMLTSDIDAINTFHTWALTQIVLAAYEALDTLSNSEKPNLDELSSFFSIETLYNIIAKIEKGVALSSEEQDVSDYISISTTRNFLMKVKDISRRKRVLILMDDAALTLTPEYMKEFFEIFRTLKSQFITPKASVYPGTTEYGSRFHPTQEGVFKSVWLSTENDSYSETMEAIAVKRIPEFSDIPEPIRELLKYAAFGVPRAYLSLLQDYIENTASRTQAQKLNSVIKSHITARVDEFKSISIKSPKLKILIESGDKVFSKICSDLKDANDSKNEEGLKQLLIGISGIDEDPYVERMFNLLVEAGLLYQIEADVSHGDDRDYKRFIPHIAALLNIKTFLSKGTASSARIAIERLQLKPTKHPIRRTKDSILKSSGVNELKFNLPSCSSCSTERISQTQKFCHNCGAELIDVSSFDQCMSIPLSDIPGLTPWMRDKIKNEIPTFETLGDFVTSQDPSKVLRQAGQIGQKRAEKIILLATTFVDEFLQ